METPAGTPPAVKVWWHQGETYGQEFVYPKDQARRLAKNASEPVLTTQEQTTTTAQTTTPNLSRMSSSGAEKKVNRDGHEAATKATGGAVKGEPAPASLKITVIVPGQDR
jgi:type IV secretory pathway VirB9-like protein